MRGVTGFGGAMLMAPPLSMLIGPVPTVVTALILETAAALVMFPDAWPKINKRVLLYLTIPACFSVPIGGYLLITLDPFIARKVIAGVVVVFSLGLLLGLRYSGTAAATDIRGTRWHCRRAAWRNQRRRSPSNSLPVVRTGPAGGDAGQSDCFCYRDFRDRPCDACCGCCYHQSTGDFSFPALYSLLGRDLGRRNTVREAQRCGCPPNCSVLHAHHGVGESDSVIRHFTAGAMRNLP